MSRIQNELNFLTFHVQVHSDFRIEGKSYLIIDLSTKILGNNEEQMDDPELYVLTIQAWFIPRTIH